MYYYNNNVHFEGIVVVSGLQILLCHQQFWPWRMTNQNSGVSNDNAQVNIANIPLDKHVIMPCMIL